MLDYLSSRPNLPSLIFRPPPTSMPAECLLQVPSAEDQSEGSSHVLMAECAWRVGSSDGPIIQDVDSYFLDEINSGSIIYDIDSKKKNFFQMYFFQFWEIGLFFFSNFVLFLVTLLGFHSFQFWVADGISEKLGPKCSISKKGNGLHGNQNVQYVPISHRKRSIYNANIECLHKK